MLRLHCGLERHGNAVVSTSACHAGSRGTLPRPGTLLGVKNMALYIRDCVSLCISDETLKAVGPFYLVSMPGEVKYATHGINVLDSTTF